MAPKKSLSRDPKLRAEAGLAYMTDPAALSIDALHKDTRFASVSKKTLERWSKEDRWVERREAFFEEWAERARQRLGSEFCRMRQRDLADLESLRTLALSHLTDEAVKPKSWEGVAKVLLEATVHRERIAQAVGDEIDPRAGAPRGALAAASEAEPEQTPEELDVAMRAILQARRDLTLDGTELLPDEETGGGMPQELRAVLEEAKKAPQVPEKTEKSEAESAPAETITPPAAMLSLG